MREESTGDQELQGESGVCLMPTCWKLGLWYTSLISDRDSAPYRAVLYAKPYGKGVEVTKKECMGHIQKRMGTVLWNQVVAYKNQVVDGRKGIGGRGRLTIQVIDSIQNYYGQAIRSNLHDLPGAKQAVQAIRMPNQTISCARKVVTRGVGGREMSQMEQQLV